MEIILLNIYILQKVLNINPPQCFFLKNKLVVRKEWDVALW